MRTIEKSGDFFRSHRVAIIGPESRRRRQDIIDSFHREISRALESSQKEYTFSYTPIEYLPKRGPSFDIRGRWGSNGNSLVRLHASPDRGRSWHSNDAPLETTDDFPGQSHRIADLAGKRPAYGSRREEGFSETLTLDWPTLA